MRDDIVQKIQKLMALAERAGTPEEAEAAFAKAQELMVRHAIDDAALKAKGHDVAREPIVVHPVHLRQRDEIKRAKLLLYMRIAEANQCKVLDATQGWDEVRIVGHESSTRFVEMLAAAVLIQYAGERTKAWKAYQKKYAARGMDIPQSRFKWVNGFAWGYAQRIGERIKEATRETGKSTGGELVLRDKSAEVDDWMNDNLRTRKGRSIGVRASWEAQSAGIAAANRADISGGRNHVNTSGQRALGR